MRRMAEHVTEHLNVGADPARCFAVATDYERYPEWAPDIKDADVLTSDAQGRGTQVHFRVAGMGRSAEYVLQYDYSHAPQRLSWHLVESNIMRVLTGQYEFTADVGGSTNIVYDLEVELIVPVPGFVKRRAESKIMTTALGQLKRRVEALTV